MSSPLMLACVRCGTSPHRILSMAILDEEGKA